MTNTARYPSLRYGQNRYRRVSYDELNNAPMDGLGLNLDRSKRSPVSPLSPQPSYRSTAQSTPGLSAGFPSPAFAQQSSYNGSEVELLRSGETPVISISRGKVRSWTWVTIFMCFLALYAFCFSGVFLGIALAKPRWGRKVGNGGNLSYNTATLLSALFSKTVELAFVAVLVATIGQILSRRAVSRRAGNEGITIADITMRSWILQPGLIFTHSAAIRYAGPTLLGILVLVSTLAATFYTTAAEALAAPKLKFGPWRDQDLMGRVDTAFANVTYLTASCDIPINDDPVAGMSCAQISYAGQSYHNFQSFLTNWTTALAAGLGNSSVDGRPRPSAMLYDNTSVVGQWITPSGENITRDSTDRLVQNVTLAFPHANLFNAARFAANEIAQPSELAGQGEYFIAGALPAPTLNVLCVGLNSTEVRPFVYEEADGEEPPTSTGPTAVDHLFDFGNFFNDSKQPAPLFPHLPIIYNTINNNSNHWGPPAVFLLSTPPPAANQDHVLCSIKVTQYPHCTSRYHAAESGGELTSHCDNDPQNTLSYSSHSKAAPIVVGHYEPNWKDIGSEWLRSIALGQGITDANASIARVVTEMTPRFEPNGRTVLDPNRPSIGEALAVLAGATTVLSSLHAPFTQVERDVGPPADEKFAASVRYKDYASGGTDDWQGVFYVVLVVVFLANCFCLVYMVRQLVTEGGPITDFCEPQNLFALAFMSSPPGGGGGGLGGGGGGGDGSGSGGYGEGGGVAPTGPAFGKRFRVDTVEQMDSAAKRQTRFYVRSADDEVKTSAAVGGDGGRGGGVGTEGSNTRWRNKLKGLQGWRAPRGEEQGLEQYRRLGA